MQPYGYYPVGQPYYGINVSGVPHIIPIQPVSNAVTPAASTTKVVTNITLGEKPPVTTVFVGNIADTVPDALVKALLMRCGNILSWKRVQGVSGKLQAFGFCDYERPESTMRCVRLLNGLKVDEKSLLVKVDSKTDELLSEYKKKKKEESEETKSKDDENIKSALTTILAEHNRKPYAESVLPKRNKDSKRELDWQSMEDMDLDDDRRNLIDKEINSFRSKFEHHDEIEEKLQKNLESQKSRSRTHLSAVGAAAMALLPSRINDVEIRDSNRRRERSRSRSLERRRKAGLALTGPPSGTITPSTGAAVRRSRDRDRSSRDRIADREDEMIKQRLERKLRDKEDAYNRMLEQWTSRERKKTSEYSREDERNRKKREDLESEAECLKEFFDDYDDEIEDGRFYEGTALQRRMADREVEEASDERDRQKETEQIDAARRKLLDNGDPNAESIILQMEQKMQEHLHKKLVISNITNVPPLSSVIPEPIKIEKIESPIGAPQGIHADENDELTKETFLFSIPNGSDQKVICPNEVFHEEEVDEKPKIKFTPGWLPPSASKQDVTLNDEKEIASSANRLSEEEKKSIIRQIIHRIPTDKDSLFAYPIEWEWVDAEIVATKIRPWVDKKMITYIGEVEATLSQFICNQVLDHNPPQKILQDISMVLDKEADDFVVKMWRLLIYVIAEKKAGFK